jgi:hypothetical protein
MRAEGLEPPRLRGRVAELHLYVGQRLAPQQPVGRCGVAQNVEANVTQTRILEGRLVPRLALHERARPENRHSGT